MVLLNDFKKDAQNILKEHMVKMILYGSYARGDNREDSDIDVMFLVDIPDDELNDYEHKIWDVTYDYEINKETEISAMLKNVDHFEHWKNSYPFYANVEHEGVVI